MAKSKNLKGIVRISEHYNHPWRGFTLQRGHFYGETLEGVYYASALERQGSNVKVYLCDTSSGDYVWSAVLLDKNNPLVKKIVNAIPKRKAMGINKVQFKPLERQDTGFSPRLTAQIINPHTPLRIPMPGTGKPVRHSFIVSA